AKGFGQTDRCAGPKQAIENRPPRNRSPEQESPRPDHSSGGRPGSGWLVIPPRGRRAGGASHVVFLRAAFAPAALHARPTAPRPILTGGRYVPTAWPAS